MSEFEDRLRQEFKDKEYADAYVEEFLNQYIATQIKVLREQRNLTQAQLAEKASMQQVRISLLENVDYHSWSIKTLKILAQALDVTLHVSFDTFSETIKRIDGFSRESLERISREDDLSQEVSEQQVSAILEQMQRVTKEKSKESILDFAHAALPRSKRSFAGYPESYLEPQNITNKPYGSLQ